MSEKAKVKSSVDWKSVAGHVFVAAAIGGLIAHFTDAKWIAACLFVSAAMFMNGSLLVYEDARPGGFDNPYRKETPAFVKGWAAVKYWAGSLGVTMALVGVGLVAQLYL